MARTIAVSGTVIPFLFACSGPDPGDMSGLQATETEYATAQAALVPVGSGPPDVRYWTNGIIPICFANMPDSDQAQRFKSSLLQTWGAVANLTFQFHDTCDAFTPDVDDYATVEFKPDATWAVGGAFGTGAFKPNGGIIGYCDPALAGQPNAWRFSGCTYAVEQERGMVVHEFGHALGFLHEHQSSQRPSDILSWCPWINQPAGAQPPSGPATETGSECRDQVDNDGDGVIDCGLPETETEEEVLKDPDCDAMCNWFGWHGNNGVVGIAYTNPYDGQPYTLPGFSLTRWDPLASVTYCPDTDGILDYDNDGVVEPSVDDEFADIVDVGFLSRTDIAAVQLIYGIKGQSLSSAGGLHVSTGFQVGTTWVAPGTGTISARWRYDGVLDSAFGSASWRSSGTLVGSGATLAMTQVASNTTASMSFTFNDFRGRTRTAAQSVERSDSKHAALVRAVMPM